MNHHHDIDVSMEALEEALVHVRDAEWTEGRLAQTRRGVQRRRRAQQVRRVAGGSLLATAAVLLLVWNEPWANSTNPRDTDVAEAATTSQTELPSRSDELTFTDGSRVVPLVAGTRMHVAGVSEGLIEVGLDAGAARFEVTPGQDRRFVVRAGELSVVVLGTVFVVDRTAEAGTRVEVERGVVRVEWAGGEQILRRGQQRAFPPVTSAEATPHPHARVRRAQWRQLAEQGEYDQAFAALQDVEGPEDLWEAADVARRAGHPEEAVPYLKQLLTRYPNGRRSQNAAFTLGRVLADLGRQGEAADAFHDAQRGGGRLAESALYREALALWAAGRPVQARDRAARYRAEYPDGRYTDALDDL